MSDAAAAAADALFDGFEPFAIKTQDDPPVTIRGLHRGTGSGDTTSSDKPPLLLLHGAPQSRHIWHRVAAQLADRFSLVVPDLRGYGASSKPAGPASYAKSIMARDMVAVMDGLGYAGDMYVCAHDRGARVAHKLGVDHPARVRRVVLLDICPTLAMYEATNMAFATAYYHWFFLIQPAPLPETLISAAPRAVAERFLSMGRAAGDGLSMFDPACVEYYCSALEDAEAVRALCDEYRAGATVDLDEARGDLARGRRIQCPTRAIWGRHGVVEKLFDGVQEWRDVVEPGVPVEGYAVESGHYIPEQVPDDVVKAVVEFFV